jgi:hypothetical protein
MPLRILPFIPARDLVDDDEPRHTVNVNGRKVVVDLDSNVELPVKEMASRTDRKPVQEFAHRRRDANVRAAKRAYVAARANGGVTGSLDDD